MHQTSAAAHGSPLVLPAAYPMAPPVAGVVHLAAASRGLVLSLYLLARLLFRPYDTSATLLPPCLSSSPMSPDPNTPVSTAISSLAVWDGVHFARPAECGYEYEQSFAFLPLLPASLALLARSRIQKVFMHFFLLEALLQAYDAAVRKKRPLLAMQALVIGALRSIFIFVPFFGFQAYGYLNICVHGSSEELRPWCKAKVPLLYGFIQSHYWGVGFLRYFQVKQLPNFLLASPVLSLAVYSIVHYTKLLHGLFQTSSIHKQIITALEERSVVSYRSSNDVTILSELSTGLTKKAQGNSMVKQRKSFATETASATFHDIMSANQNMEENQDARSILLLPFVLHLLFMTFTAFFVMHVQVSTRFLSASPPIYWAAAHILASPSRSSKRWGYLICVYFIAYILLGSLLFSNFYPFT